MNPLYNKLVEDVYKIGLPIDFLLTLKDYSKSYYARYWVESSNIVLYTKDEYGNDLPYEELLTHLIHEAVHHYQWKHDPDFVREKGVMHSYSFWIKYHTCIAKAHSMNLLGGYLNGKEVSIVEEIMC